MRIATRHHGGNRIVPGGTEGMKFTVVIAEPNGSVQQINRYTEVIMQRTQYVLLVSALALSALPALAQCPSTLNAEQMIDCIVTENAGNFYLLKGKVTAMDPEVIQPATTQQEQPADNSKDFSAANKSLTN